MTNCFERLNATDNIVEWRPYIAGQEICNRFPIDEWHKMVADIDSDEDWEQFLSEYPQFVKCYVLYRINDNEPIAFAYTMQEDEHGKVVSFHGGGWNKSISHTFLYYRGMTVLVEILLNCGFRVRTACRKENLTAYRFIKSAGFVNYRNSDTYHYFWINKKRLYNSKIYKKFKGNL